MIYIGADHRGFELKGVINNWLKRRGYEFEDLGAYAYEHGDDYVDFAVEVAQRVTVDQIKNRGIVICGSGVGMCIAANKVKGIRAGLGFEEDQVFEARKDDDINVLSLPADNIETEKALKLVEKFLTTEFVESDNYLRRRDKVKRYETQITCGF